MLNIIEADQYHLFKDDPVRPHLSQNFRTSLGREAFVLVGTDAQPRAVICCAYTTQVPTTQQELDLFSQAAAAEGGRGHIAIFYTVWSYTAGAGRDIVFAARDFCRDTRGCTRFVTLSPLTKMAEKFHIRNGAHLVDRYDLCQNFEYPA